MGRRYVYIKQTKQPEGLEIIEQVDIDVWLCVTKDGASLTGHDIIAEIKGDTVVVLDPAKFKPTYERNILGGVK